LKFYFLKLFVIVLDFEYITFTVCADLIRKEPISFPYVSTTITDSSSNHLCSLNLSLDHVHSKPLYHDAYFSVVEYSLKI